MYKLHRVRLTPDERRQLTELTRHGSTAVRRVRRARALLLAAAGKPDAEIAEAVGTCPRTIARLRQRATEEGAMPALDDRVRPGGTPMLDSAAEAVLIATACSDPPAGRAHWTMQLLAERLVELTVVPAISDETVRRALKKTPSSPGGASTGAFRR